MRRFLLKSLEPLKTFGQKIVTRSFESHTVAGLNEAEMLVAHQTGSLRSTCKRGTPVAVRTLCEKGRLKEALHILEQQDVQPDPSTYVCLLQGCINLKALAEGKQVHAHIMRSTLKPNTFVVNTLLNMYAKCGSLVDARRVFDEMPQRDIFTWTMMMAGYAKHGHAEEALRIYGQMQQEGVTPDRVMFICVLNACASLGALERGKQIHDDILRTGVPSDNMLETTLVHMYAKCGSVKDARQVFDKMAKRDVVSWSAMIAGYAQSGHGEEALRIYEQMQKEGITPDRVTFICVLNACGSLGALDRCKQVYADIIKAEIASFVQLDNTLVDTFAKCGSIENARKVFDRMARRDVVSCSAMIAGYAQYGYGREAVKIYEQMQQEGVIPDSVTFICVLNACASLRALGTSKQVHADIIKAGNATYVNLENTLVDTYAKCGSIEDARQVFDKMAERDVVSWNAMIGGYTQHGCDTEALEAYEQMQHEGVTPNWITFISILKACASLAVLEEGQQVHADIIAAGIASYLNLDNALVDMYAKCGSIKDARQVFNKMEKRDVVSWSAMMTGYAQHGCGREALQLFEQMQQEGLKPDGVTLTSVLSACSHGGLVDEGCHYFNLMSRNYGLTPTVEHFGCMVDLLGRAGRLDEAEDFINKMSIVPDALVWGALLGGCSIHRNAEVAERAAKCILSFDPRHSETHAAMLHLAGGTRKQR